LFTILISSSYGFSTIVIFSIVTSEGVSTGVCVTSASTTSLTCVSSILFAGSCTSTLSSAKLNVKATGFSSSSSNNSPLNWKS
jgi:hypothetical protein